MRQERRRHPRIKVSHAVAYSSFKNPNSMLALTVDLSTGGARIETPFTLAIGELLELSIGIPPQVIKCRGKVMHITRVMGRRLKAGIRFSSLSERDRLYLTKYLSSVMKRPAGETNPFKRLTKALGIGF